MKQDTIGKMRGTQDNEARDRKEVERERESGKSEMEGRRMRERFECD